MVARGLSTPRMQRQGHSRPPLSATLLSPLLLQLLLSTTHLHFPSHLSPVFRRPIFALNGALCLQVRAGTGALEACSCQFIRNSPLASGVQISLRGAIFSEVRAGTGRADVYVQKWSRN